MTTITPDDLQMAALAAGLTPIGWRPHTDIADAARLAVRLRFAVAVDHAAAEVVDVDGAIVALVPHNDADEDAERAYCEAVTLGAAAEGRRMREGQQ